MQEYTFYAKPKNQARIRQAASGLELRLIEEGSIFSVRGHPRGVKQMILYLEALANSERREARKKLYPFVWWNPLTWF